MLLRGEKLYCVIGRILYVYLLTDISEPLGKHYLFGSDTCQGYLNSTHLYLARWTNLHIFELDDSRPTSLKYVDKLTL